MYSEKNAKKTQQLVDTEQECHAKSDHKDKSACEINFWFFAKIYLSDWGYWIWIMPLKIKGQN